MSAEAKVPSERDAAIAYLFRLHYPSLVRLAFLLTSDSLIAEDVAQESFIKVWGVWRRLNNPEAGHAYLRTTVVNLSLSRLRRRLVEKKALTDRAVSSAGFDLSGSIDLGRALPKLSTRQRACVVLRYFEDLSERETARVLGVSVGTVKSQTHKALRRLENLMGGAS